MKGASRECEGIIRGMMKNFSENKHEETIEHSIKLDRLFRSLDDGSFEENRKPDRELAECLNE